jgi:hypothetical protein
MFTTNFQEHNLRHAQKGGDRSAWLIASGLLLLLCAWALAIFFIKPVRFAVFAPRASVGVEAAAALARLFGALVLSLSRPIEPGSGCAG